MLENIIRLILSFKAFSFITCSRPRVLQKTPPYMYLSGCCSYSVAQFLVLDISHWSIVFESLSVSDTSPKSIDREALRESHTGTRQATVYSLWNVSLLICQQGACIIKLFFML